MLAVHKKRLFLVASIKLELKEILAIKKEKEEEEPKSLLDLLGPSILLFRENYRVAYRTRKRYTL